MNILCALSKGYNFEAFCRTDFQKLMQYEFVLHHAEEDSLPKAQRGGRGKEKGTAID